MDSVPLATRLVVMSFHPITANFLVRIREILGPVDALYNAAELRKKAPLAAMRELRAIRTDKLVIALEGDAGRALLAPLSIAASFTRAGVLLAIWPDLRIERIGRFRSLLYVVRALRDTVASRWSMFRSLRAGITMRKSALPRMLTPSAGNHVLYVDANISLGSAVGGSVGHTAGVIDAFVRHAFVVDYASLKPIPTNRPGAQAFKVEPQTLLAIPPELNFYPYAEMIEKRILAARQASQWSFIYQRFSMHNFSGPRLGRRLGIPVVVEYNGSEAWAAKNWGTTLALHDSAVAAEAIALDSADLIVTVSDELGREIRDRGIPENRVLVYPNCVDPDVFDPRRFTAAEIADVRKRHGIRRDACVVGFIGTFGQWHGVEFLAGCIRDLVNEDREWIAARNVHFMLVGDGLKMPIVREILDAPSVLERATLTGLVAQSDAPRYLACADVLVSPHVPNADGSNFFGSPTKVFEYMAMEKPIVAAALGQIADVIAGRGAVGLGNLPPGTGEMCGFLHEPGDVKGFKTVLKAVIDDMPAASSRARAARAEVLNRYTWDRHVDAILGAMERNGLLSRRRDA